MADSAVEIRDIHLLVKSLLDLRVTSSWKELLSPIPKTESLFDTYNDKLNDTVVGLCPLLYCDRQYRIYDTRNGDDEVTVCVSCCVSVTATDCRSLTACI